MIVSLVWIWRAGRDRQRASRWAAASAAYFDGKGRQTRLQSCDHCALSARWSRWYVVVLLPPPTTVYSRCHRHLFKLRTARSETRRSRCSALRTRYQDGAESHVEGRRVVCANRNGVLRQLVRCGGMLAAGG